MPVWFVLTAHQYRYAVLQAGGLARALGTSLRFSRYASGWAHDVLRLRADLVHCPANATGENHSESGTALLAQVPVALECAKSNN